MHLLSGLNNTGALTMLAAMTTRFNNSYYFIIQHRQVG